MELKNGENFFGKYIRHFFRAGFFERNLTKMFRKSFDVGVEKCTRSLQNSLLEAIPKEIETLT